MYRITGATVLEDYRLDLEFDDGVRGVADLTDLAGHGVFAAWNDYDAFRMVAIGSAGELIWPGEIDLCPDALYMQVTGRSPEDVFPALKHHQIHA